MGTQTETPKREDYPKLATYHDTLMLPTEIRWKHLLLYWRPVVRQDFYVDYPRSVYLRDGSRIDVVYSTLHSGKPEFMREPPEHEEDWCWEYPVIRKGVLTSAPPEVTEADFISHAEAMKVRDGVPHTR